MANTNFTSMLAQQRLGDFTRAYPQHPELEKISCSLASFGEADLLALRGKRIDVLQRSEHLPTCRFVAQVMAVQLPALGTGVETCVVIHQDGHEADYLEYVDVSELTLLEVLSETAPARVR